KSFGSDVARHGGESMLESLLRRMRRWQMRTCKPFGKTPTAAMRLSLCDSHADMADRLAAAFHDVDAVEVVEGNLLDLSFDALVSPANSFGDMSGGIDKAIDDFHRGAAQRAVRAAIEEHCYGELPVGSALVVELRGAGFRFVVAAPTMRIPGSVSKSINAYL